MRSAAGTALSARRDVDTGGSSASSHHDVHLGGKSRHHNDRADAGYVDGAVWLGRFQVREVA